MPRRAPNPAAGANRTDLMVPQVSPQGPGQPNGIPAQVQPIRVPTGLPYGENQQLTQDQQAAPLQQAPSPMAAALAGPAKNFVVPPNLGLTRPTERPNEPIGAGLPGSPIGTPAPRQVGSLSSMISAVAQAANSPALSQLAARAASAGQ